MPCFFYMKSKYELLIIFIGSVFTAFLALISEYLENTVIDFSSQNMFGFGFSGILYIFVPIYFFFLGMVAATVFLRIKSLKNTVLVSILIGLIVSIPSIKEFIVYYFGFEPFHETYFKASIFQFFANLVIFPLLGYVIWNLKDRFYNSYLKR